jgi:hypothetical protein
MIDSIQGAESLADKASRFVAPEVTVAKRDSGRYVKYLGPEHNRATERSISPSDWAEVGVVTDVTNVWDWRNEYLLSESLFTPAQLNYLLNVDGFFSSVEVK